MFFILHESAEDYLETILMLKERLGMVRSIDIVNQTGYSKPSVSVAMKKLRESGHITMDKDGYITLTEQGSQVAQRVYQRHRLLTRFFMTLGVSEETASADACKIEHDLSEETFRCILEHARRHLDDLPGEQ